jgi:hypothetical protein
MTISLTRKGSVPDLAAATLGFPGDGAPLELDCVGTIVYLLQGPFGPTPGGVGGITQDVPYVLTAFDVSNPSAPFFDSSATVTGSGLNAYGISGYFGRAIDLDANIYYVLDGGPASDALATELGDSGHSVSPILFMFDISDPTNISYTGAIYATRDAPSDSTGFWDETNLYNALGISIDSVGPVYTAVAVNPDTDENTVVGFRDAPSPTPSDIDPYPGEDSQSGLFYLSIADDVGWAWYVDSQDPSSWFPSPSSSSSIMVLSSTESFTSLGFLALDPDTDIWVVIAVDLSGTPYGIYQKANGSLHIVDNTGSEVSEFNDTGKIVANGTNLFVGGQYRQDGFQQVGSGDINVWDVTDPTAPNEIAMGLLGATSLPYGNVQAFDLSSDGTTLYTIDEDINAGQVEFAVWEIDYGGGGGGGGGAGDADGNICVWVVDIETLVSAAYLVPLTASGTPGTGGRACSSAGYIYFSDSSSGTVWVLDVTNAQNPKYLGSVQAAGPILDMFVCGAQLYLAMGNFGAAIYDVTVPATPTLVSTFGSGGVNYTSVWGNIEWVFLTDPTAGGFAIYDISTPASPAILFTTEGYPNVSDIVVEGTFVYVTDLEGTISVIEFFNSEGTFLINDISDSFTGPPNVVPGLGWICVADGQIFGAQANTVASAQLTGAAQTGEVVTQMTVATGATGSFAGTDAGGNVIPNAAWTTGKPVVVGPWLIVGGQSSGEYAVAVFYVGGFECTNVHAGALFSQKIDSARISSEVIDVSNTLSAKEIVALGGVTAEDIKAPRGFSAIEIEGDPSSVDLAPGRFNVFVNKGTGQVVVAYNDGERIKTRTLV